MYASTAFHTGWYALVFTTVWAGSNNKATASGVSKQARPLDRPPLHDDERLTQKKYIGHLYTDRYHHTGL